jgi:hypothetical protein
MFILHYTKPKSGEEYIVLLEQDETPSKQDIEDNQLAGYTPEKPVECECYDTGVLPFSEPLHKRH